MYCKLHRKNQMPNQFVLQARSQQFCWPLKILFGIDRILFVKLTCRFFEVSLPPPRYQNSPFKVTPQPKYTSVLLPYWNERSSFTAPSKINYSFLLCFDIYWYFTFKCYHHWFVFWISSAKNQNSIRKIFTILIFSKIDNKLLNDKSHLPNIEFPVGDNLDNSYCHWFRMLQGNQQAFLRILRRSWSQELDFWIFASNNNRHVIYLPFFIC